MPRQRLPLGECGRITERKDGDRFVASTYVRLHSGKLREREASSNKSAEDAVRKLKDRIKAELAAGEPSGVIDHTSTLGDLFTAWMADKVAMNEIGERTATLYRDVWDRHGEEQLGSLLITELRPGRADAHVKSLPRSQGTYMRIILTGMCSLAVRYEVLTHSPMRELKAVRKDPKDKVPARALTSIELEQVRQAVTVYSARRGPGPRRGVMLPAFVELLAATGVRPAEVLAVRWEDVDLLADPPTAEVNGTVKDAGAIKGKGIHRQPWRKGHAPPHTVILPAFGVQALADLLAITGPTGTVLKNRDGGLIALTNIRSSLRDALSGYPELAWVTPYSFRRTVATVVSVGMGTQAAQHQLSHRQQATTERHYVQPATAGPDTRAVLGEWGSKQV